ncbi:MAG: hypothetical protein D6794_06535 [Deltaproteobacteria bacterium]|nr:MAG: hypothetical protein D6794_06535 [Deltaproteobacteria bacterium]
MNEERPEEQQGEQHTTEEQKRRGVEKIWDATLGTWHSATFRAAKYSKLVQKKIDLNAVHKKITAAHTDLGKKIDEFYHSGTSDIMNHEEVRQMLASLSELRQQAAALEEEIATIRSQEMPTDEPHEESPPEGTA